MKELFVSNTVLHPREGAELRLQLPEGCIGVVCVFETEEKANAWCSAGSAIRLFDEGPTAETGLCVPPNATSIKEAM